MISAGVVRVFRPKSEIFNTKRPSIRQLHERSLPWTATSEPWRYAIPCTLKILCTRQIYTLGSSAWACAVQEALSCDPSVSTQRAGVIIGRRMWKFWYNIFNWHSWKYFGHAKTDKVKYKLNYFMWDSSFHDKSSMF